MQRTHDQQGQVLPMTEPAPTLSIRCTETTPPISEVAAAVHRVPWVSGVQCDKEAGHEGQHVARTSSDGVRMWGKTYFDIGLDPS